MNNFEYKMTKLNNTLSIISGCLRNSDLCDRNEYCHNDNYEGVCLQDRQLDSDEEIKSTSNDNILNNLNDDDNESELNDNLNDKAENAKELKFDDSPSTGTDDDFNLDEWKDSDDLVQRCMIDFNVKYKKYKYDLSSDTYIRFLKALCDDYISNGNEPKIPLVDDDRLDVRDYLLSLIEQTKNKEPTKQANGESDLADNAKSPDNAYEVGDFVIANDKSRNGNLDDNLKAINQNLYEAELLARENLNRGLDNNIDKKFDQKKPGPQFTNNGIDEDDLDLDKLGVDRFVDKFDDKRFDQSRIQSENAQFDNTGILKRKFGTTPSIAPDHKPVEEGSVHVELGPQNKIQLVEPTLPNEQASPFVAVDSSYAYIYFLKYPKQSTNNQSRNHPRILNDEQLMAQDDILARRYFVNNLEKRMNLPKGSFSDLKLDSAESSTLSECVSFPLLKYLIIFDNDEQNCNCKCVNNLIYN